MNELIITSKFLHQVLFEDISLKNLLKKESNNPEFVNNRAVILSVISCELKHHFLFLHLLGEKISEFSTEEVCDFFVVLANNYYAKKISENEANNWLKQRLGSKYLDIVLFTTTDKNLYEFINPDFKRESFEYLSLRFNLPLWLLKMWKKHLNTNEFFKLLRGILSPEEVTFRVNTIKNSSEFVIQNNSDFVETNVPDVLKCTAKLGRNKLSLMKEYSLIQENIGMKDAFDKCITHDYHDVFLYTEKDITPFLDLRIRIGNRCSYNIGCENIKIKSEASKLLEKSMKFINIFEVINPMEMDAALSNPMDLVVCFPNSTDLYKARQYPDYLVTFNSQTIDEIIRKEKLALDGCAKYVYENGGELIYMTQTVSMKENHNIIAAFLNDNKDFELISEKQYIPYSEISDVFYYAHLRKKKV